MYVLVAFIKPHGTHTAANSSYLTDGSAATLIMSEEKALELGFVPKSVIKSWSFVAVDPFEDLLLGPTFAVHDVLEKAKLKLSDMDHFEIRTSDENPTVSLMILTPDPVCR